MRSRDHLRLRYQLVTGYTGRMVLGVGATLLLPLVAFPAFPGETTEAGALVLAAAIAVVLGLVLQRLGRLDGDVGLREGGLIVLATWVLAIVLAALPFVFAGTLGMRDALFESTSGWTTTGLSMVDVTRVGPLMLLWRSVMQLVGGAGFAVVMLAALVGPPGVGFASAEGRGDQLLPNVQRSMVVVLRIYLSCTLVGVVAYVACGMAPFDAVNHAFGALSTGGFSTRPESIGAYDSAAIELVTVILMLIGTSNFAVLWALCRGRVREVLRNGEVRLGSLLLVAFVPVVLVTAVLPHHQGARAARVAAFETVSALSTTGYSTVAYGNWPDVAVLCLVVLMLIGGGTCSTAGGLKLHRAYVLLRSIGWQLRSYLLPARAVTRREVWKGDQVQSVSSADVEQMAGFLTLYLATYAAGVLVITYHGYSLRDAMFEFASCIGTVGLSIGVTSPSAPTAVVWTQIAGMFLGRLEFFVVLYALLDLGRDAREAWRVGRGP